MVNRKQLIEEILENLYVLKNKMHARVIRPRLKDFVTHSQLLVLFVIEEHRNIGIKEISKILNVSSSAATQIVDGLVESGYVVRNVSLADRRALRIGISPVGRTRIVALKKKYMGTIAALFNALSDEELKLYLKLHKKIVSGISANKQ